MSTKITDLAKKLNLKPKELKDKINELGFETSQRARVIEDDIAELIYEELNTEKQTSDSQDIAEVYDELVSEELDREIIKTQRKKTAGKEDKKKKEETKKEEFSIKKGTIVEINENISVKELAEKTGIKIAKIIGELMKNGILANINQQIDFETAQIVMEEFGIKLKRIRKAAGAEELISGDITKLLEEDTLEDLKERPPVVCVMGHVDHGKTQLLDTIRKANVISKESGGITQHIGAYQVEKKGKKITFLDTPGHEAFTSMRARGAKITDIAILIVAADEGVKPQTIEAINHAKDAKVPIIVAINKMDKPEANVDKIKGELSEHELQAEDWGGDTIMVPISALKNTGIEDLLEMILLTTEMQNLKANPNREAIATVVEANLDHSLGPVATILINTGTLKIMNSFVVGNTYGRVKLMKDQNGKNIRSAGPSTPILIAGLHKSPKSGDILQVVKNEKIARIKSEEIEQIDKITNEKDFSLTNQLISQVQSEKLLKLIIKADTKGSLEAIKQSLAKIKDEEVAIKIIHSGVGTVTESDVMMASASKGLILSFHSKFDNSNVEKVAEREKVEIKNFTVIYDLIENVKQILTGLLEPEIEEVVLGRAEVLKIFYSKKKEMIIGVKVKNGKLKNKAKLKIIREKTEEKEDNIIGKGEIDSLKKVDKNVNEVKEGSECGIRFVGDSDVQEGDILEAYEENEKIRSIK